MVLYGATLELEELGAISGRGICSGRKCGSSPSTTPNPEPRKGRLADDLGTSLDVENARQATILELELEELLTEAEVHHRGPAGSWNAKGSAHRRSKRWQASSRRSR